MKEYAGAPKLLELFCGFALYKISCKNLRAELLAVINLHTKQYSKVDNILLTISFLITVFKAQVSNAYNVSTVHVNCQYVGVLSLIEIRIKLVCLRKE